MSRILSAGLKLTAINRLITECNEKNIRGSRTDELSQKLGFKSFRDYVEQTMFNGCSIPDGVIIDTEVPLYSGLVNRIHEVLDENKNQTEKVINITPKPKQTEKKQSTAEVKTQKKPSLDSAGKDKGTHYDGVDYFEGPTKKFRGSDYV